MPVFGSSIFPVPALPNAAVFGFSGCGGIEGLPLDAASLNAVLINILNTASPCNIPQPFIGSIASLPAGWRICDGTNGTPDMRGRAVIGSSAAYPRGTTGGSADHTHTTTASETVLDAGQIPPHAHHVFIPQTSTGVGALPNTSAYAASNSGGDQEYSMDFAATSPTGGITSLPVDAAGTPLPTAQAGHTHDVTVSSASNLMPYISYPYIVRLCL